MSIARSLAYTSHRIRHGLVLRDSSTRPWLFHSLNRSSICHRTRAKTRASRSVKRAEGTLVTRTVQAASASRPALTLPAFFLGGFTEPPASGRRHVLGH